MTTLPQVPSLPTPAPGKLIHWRMVTQSWFHSRKALIFLVVFVIANVALFVKLIDGGQWIDVIKWSCASYMGANVADGIASALSSKGSDQ